MTMTTGRATERSGSAGSAAAGHPVRDTARTTVHNVASGPAGTVLSLLLARRNIAVTLLEAHQDFDREFRGDTLHPSTMEIIDQLGLADRLLQIPHTRVDRFSFPICSQLVT